MTYSLPFDLTQKPVRKYVEGGSIHFSIRDGRMFYTVTRTIRLVMPERFKKEKLYTGEVKTKEQYHKLLSTKTLADVLQTIEVVA